MKIMCNSEVRDVVGTTLAIVLEELGFAGAVLATAVNGAFVPATTRHLASLKSGDAIEVLAPMQGG